jgi:hypothetical protein
MLIISVDFDGTLALGNKSHITSSEPNYTLIEKLRHLKQDTDAYIKIVTARGAKNNLSLEEKQKKYLKLIEQFCINYSIPFDEISFNKEYAHLYIDDMTIGPNDNFHGLVTEFTSNKILFTNNSVIKYCKTSLLEKEWYDIADSVVKVPKVLFCNDELIITEKIQDNSNVFIEDILNILEIFKNNQIKNYSFTTYIENLIVPDYASKKTKEILSSLPEHPGTFFHGDLSISNVLKGNGNLFLIDPNYKYIFGSYITDAGKAFFSYIAYNQDYSSAKKIQDKYGDIILNFAVSEGSRVCKYRPEYISFVNNIAELI